jgi:hypothetical protein
MALTAQSAAAQIMAGYNETLDAAGSVTARAASARAAPSDFCKLWPQAKPILELLSGIAILIPGLGAAAGGILRGLIALGDQIAKDTCK